MEFNKRKTVFDNLNKYDYICDKDDFIEVTEWTNGEGYDISFKNRTIQLTTGELDAIKYLVDSLQFHKFDK